MRKIRTVLLTAAIMMLAVCAGVGEEAVFQPKDLPVIYVQIDGGQAETEKMNSSPDHSYRCTGTMDLVVPEGYSGGYEGRFPQRDLRGLKMEYIRGRGNGTWGMSKHPYKIKLRNKENLFGLGKNKHWVLLSNYFDNSLIRNWITEWIGEQIGLEYTPMGTFVEVVMNGEYLGTYYLCEQIRVSSARVDIDELTNEDTGFPAIQGGYLMEFFPDDEDMETSFFETEAGVRLGNKSPNFNPSDGGYVNDVQKAYIRVAVQRMENAFRNEGPDADGKTWEDYVDAQSLADYWWIMEFSENADAFTTDSSLFFKKRFEADGSEGKFHFGPLWDFDESWGNAYLTTFQKPGFNNAYSAWVNMLRERPEFLDYLKERWTVMDGLLEEMVREGGVLDKTCALLRNAWYRDRERWLPAREEDGTLVERNFEEEIEHLRGWIRLRRAWVNEHLDRLGLMECVVTIVIDGQAEEYRIPCDTVLDLMYMDAPEKDGLQLTWVLEDGTGIENDVLFVDRDMTVTAVYAE